MNMYLMLSNAEGASFCYSHLEHIADNQAESVIIKVAESKVEVDLPDPLC